MTPTSDIQLQAQALFDTSEIEDLEVVRGAVRDLYGLLRSPESRPDRKVVKALAMGARKNLRVLERFGRFPQHNVEHNRETTAAESVFLAQRRHTARALRPPAPRRLKVLVLHGFRQSARRLRQRLRKLDDALSDFVEFIYVDAPHTYLPEPEELAKLQAELGVPPDFSAQRRWWTPNPANTVYEGWEASVRVIDAHLPVDGVLGFSQGSALAGLFAALRTDAIRFAICVSGFPSRADAHRMLTLPNGVDLPSLHITGATDVLVDHARSEALAGCFVDAQQVQHRGGHFAPEQLPLDILRSFLWTFLEAPPPVQQLDDPRWSGPLTLGEVRSQLPRGDALRDLLSEVRQRFPPESRHARGLVQPRSDDLAHRVWMAAWEVDPELVTEVLNTDEHWASTAWLALRATQELADPAGLVATIARRFAEQIVRDEHSGALSYAALAAPRPRSGLNQATRLGSQIAALLSPDRSYTAASAAYRRRVSDASKPIRALARRVHGQSTHSPSAEVAPEVTRPRPVPVIPCPLEELDPLLAFLDSKAKPLIATPFPRGTVMPDGRLDLCKQVVGPAGIGPLLTSLEGNPNVKRLLLGNNVVGPTGAARIATFLGSGASRVKVWYLAGNEIDAESLGPICEALRSADEVEGLWLKRNPLGAEAAAPLSALFASNPPIETLDLVNTGLLDAGTIELCASLTKNTRLRHLYLGTNGLSTACAPALADLLRHDQLHSLYIDCNRFGDEGIAVLAEALGHNRTLRRLSLASNRIGPKGLGALLAGLASHPSLVFLNLGWTRATTAVHEDGNHIGDAGAALLADFLRSNAVLRALDISHNGITERGLNALHQALADNTSLVDLRSAQRHTPTPLDSVARLRGSIDRNCRAAGLDRDDVEAIRTPLPTREVLSVYRTAPMGG